MLLLQINVFRLSWKCFIVILLKIEIRKTKIGKRNSPRLHSQNRRIQYGGGQRSESKTELLCTIFFSTYLKNFPSIFFLLKRDYFGVILGDFWFFILCRDVMHSGVCIGVYWPRARCNAAGRAHQYNPTHTLTIPSPHVINFVITWNVRAEIA